MRAGALLAVLVLLVSVGCAQRPIDGGPGSVEIAPPPDGFRVTTFVVSASKPVDTNANGLADECTVVAYLFGPPEQYALPVWADGEIVFTLRAPESTEPIVQWRFAAEEARSTRQLTQVGPAFALTLSVLDVAGPRGDAFRPRKLELIGEFRLSDGSATVQSSAMPIQFPGVRRGGS